MNAISESLAKIGRGKALALAALAAVLVYVVFMGEADDEPGPASAQAGEQDRSKKPRTRPAPLQTSRPIPWPKVTLDEMLAHNPFAVAPAFRKALGDSAPPATDEEARAAADRAEQQRQESLAAAQAAATLEALKSGGVKMILRTERGAAALVGDRLVYEGDILEGVRIVAIKPTGITVEPVLPRESDRPRGPSPHRDRFDIPTPRDRIDVQGSPPCRHPPARSASPVRSNWHATVGTDKGWTMNTISETPLVCVDGSVTVIDLGHDYKQIGESQLDAMRGRLLEISQTVNPPLVVIDLTGTTFFGSSFIELLFRIGNRLRLRQGRLALCGLDPYCAEVLSITRVDRLWPTFADRASAVAALQTAIPVAS